MNAESFVGKYVMKDQLSMDNEENKKHIEKLKMLIDMPTFYSDVAAL